MSYFRPSPLFLMFDGQSLNNTPEIPDNYPYLLALALGATYENEAISAASWGQLRRSIARRTLPFSRAGVVTVYAMCGGTHDIWLGASGAEVYSRMVEVAEAATAAGYTYVIGTTITPSDTFLIDDREARRLAANAAILADADNAFSAVVDFADTPGLDDYESIYYADELHWSADGAALAAATAEPIIAALVA
jgi:hypothetical protein